MAAKAIAGKQDCVGFSLVGKLPFGNALVPGGIAVTADGDEPPFFEQSADRWCLGVAVFKQQPSAWTQALARLPHDRCQIR